LLCEAKRFSGQGNTRWALPTEPTSFPPTEVPATPHPAARQGIGFQEVARGVGRVNVEINFFGSGLRN
jgi:hypothetical protein